MRYAKDPSRRCAEGMVRDWDVGCGNLPIYEVQTASGWLPFCDIHSIWFRQKGPDIYPIRVHADAPSFLITRHVLASAP